MLVLATFFWAGNFAIGKFAFLEDIPPYSLTFFRWLTVWFILLPFTYKEILNNSIRWIKTVKKTGSIACRLNLESDDAYRVIDYLYSKSKISLDRKKEKAES